MPIKFRCPHCQQFLGISRARAGAVTDCPMCGRGIRVPLLDGSVPDLPDPELNLGDQRLASALDKLAGLATGDPTPVLADANRPAATDPGPVALPEPLEIQPAPAPVVVVAEPQPRLPLPTHSSAASSRPAVQVLTELADAPVPQTDSARYGNESYGREDRRPPRRYLTALLAIVMSGIGFVLGRVSDTGPNTPPPAPVVAPVVAPAALLPPPVNVEPALTGRVSYVGPDGEVRPDAGARLLILPEERTGTAKLAADGFRSGAQAADLRLATASLRALGGDFAVAAADGSYAASLPQAGAFQVLILSRYQPRAEGTPPDPAALQRLEPYFDRPAQVVGESASHLSPLRYRGSGVATRDQTFEQQ